MAGTANTANMANGTDRTSAANRRRSRTARARLLLAVAVASVGLVAIAAAAACLPDLAAISAEDASLEAGPITHFQGCGDGIIATLDDGGDAGESCDPGPDAQVPGCTADCHLKCEDKVDETSGHCYFVAGNDSTFQNANMRCQAARAHLVTFASADEAAFVDARLHSDAGSYWVGLTQKVELGGAYGANQQEEPGFPFGAGGSCSGCFGIGAEGGAFPSADAGGTPQQCLASIAGSWLQVPCNQTSGTTRATICEREPVGARAQDCIGGFCFTLPSTAGTKRYLVAVAATDPDTAAQSCAGFDGGSLVVFGSREEREQLGHEIRARYPEEVDQQLWIGLAEDGGAWAWDDGVVAVADAGRPLPWGNAQPSTVAGARAYMHLTTTAYDTELAYADDGTKPPRLYICQRRPE